MSVRACPQCEAQFIATVTRCADCGVALEFVDEEGGVGDPAEDLVDPVGYQLDDWTKQQRAELTSMLMAERAPHRWEGDELVVEERHADWVEELIDEMDHPDALEVDADDGDDTGASLLSSLYVASDVLAGDPDNPGAVAELIETVDALEGASAPYGVDPPTWSTVTEQAEGLADLLGESSADEEVRQAARALRDVLRPLV